MPKESNKPFERFVEIAPDDNRDPAPSEYSVRRADWETWGFDYFNPVYVLHHTLKALKVRDLKGNTFWVPLSQLHPNSEVPKEESGTLTVKPWFAQKCGWLDARLFTVYNQEDWKI